MRVGVLVSALLLAMPASAQIGAFFKRVEFIDWSEGEQSAFVAGVTDAMTSGAMRTLTEKQVAKLSDCYQGGGITIKQIRLTTLAEINAAPELLHWSAAGAVFDAISKICRLSDGPL